MKLPPTVDMGGVTRLTRAGKLGEAVALIQRGLGFEIQQTDADREQSAPTNAAASSSETIDLTAPSIAGGAWADRGRTPTATDPKRASGVQPRPGARFEERLFSIGAASRTYKLFVPSDYRGQALPLVVMLHGCSQDPDDFAAGTRMNELAEASAFLVAYPRQPQSANAGKCWNWFNASDQRRGGGEPALIAGIALQVIEEFSVDRRRVYVAGLSAGGAAAANMAATYPDVFAAVGVHSGLACGAAADMQSAFAAMSGHGVSAAAAAGRQPTLPTIVFHGDADRTVNPVNSDRIIAQARPHATLTKKTGHGTAPGGLAYTRTILTDESGREPLEQWVVHGMGHAWSGGSTSGSYVDARGPDASREMIRFFLSHTNGSAG